MKTPPCEGGAFSVRGGAVLANPAVPVARSAFGGVEGRFNQLNACGLFEAFDDIDRYGDPFSFGKTRNELVLFPLAAR